MARIIIIGGIESTFRNAQILHDLGEDIAMFYTRGVSSPGWESVKMIDASAYAFYDQVPVTEVQGNINDHTDEMASLKPDFIYSLGWQQLYRKPLLSLCPVIGIHESLLPWGAGAVPIANAILNDFEETGCSLFHLDGGMDTGPLIGQLKCPSSPQQTTSTQLYKEAMEISGELLRMFVPHINSGIAPKIPQDMTSRTTYGKVDWQNWPSDKVTRARTYPYD